IDLADDRVRIDLVPVQVRLHPDGRRLDEPVLDVIEDVEAPERDAAEAEGDLLVVRVLEDMEELVGEIELYSLALQARAASDHETAGLVALEGRRRDRDRECGITERRGGVRARRLLRIIL